MKLTPTKAFHKLTPTLLIITGLTMIWLGWQPVAAQTPAVYPQQIKIRVDTLPEPDPAFLPKMSVAPASPLYMEWPQLRTERDGSLSAIYSWGYRDHVFYIHSTTNGLTWTLPVEIGGDPRWGGSAGNLNLAADSLGQLHGCWYELYGEFYPSIHCRTRGADGIWRPAAEVPGSGGERQKVNALGVDREGQVNVLAGRSARSLNLFRLGPAGYSALYSLPLTTTSAPSPSWLPELGFAKGGKMLITYGDRQVDDLYRIRSLWFDTDGLGTSRIWHSYFFTETDAAGQYTNEEQQYRMSQVQLAEGGIGLAFECRAQGQEAKDICYREWDAKRFGTAFGGWQTDTVRFMTPPEQTVAPELCIDERGQRYLVWMDQWANMWITISWSRDGIHWSYPVRINGGSYSREKHPSCAVNQGRLHIMWNDRITGDAQLWYTSRELPALYPPLPSDPAATATPSATTQP